MAKMVKKNSLESLFKEFIKTMDDRSKILSQVEPIDPKDWSATHPKMIRTGADRFYTSVVNELQKKLAGINLDPNIPDNLINGCAMAAAAYLEDFVNDLGVWDTLREIYFKTYGTYLPFYDTSHSDYYTDDLNPEDLKILVWWVFCQCGREDGRIFSPYSRAVEAMGEVAYDFIVEKVESAPVNNRVKDYIADTFAKKDFYTLRDLGHWLSVYNRLTAYYALADELIPYADELQAKLGSHLGFPEAFYYAECKFSWLPAISLMGCPTNGFLAAMARRYGYHDTAELLETIKPLPSAKFQIEKLRKNCMIVTDRAGCRFDVEVDSFHKDTDVKNFKSMIGGLVRFGENWWVNGLCLFDSHEPDWKDSDFAVGREDEIMEHCRKLIDCHKGRRVFCFKDLKEVDDFMGRYRPVLLEDDEETEVENFVLFLSTECPPVLMDNYAQIISGRFNKLYGNGWSDEELQVMSLNLIADGIVPDDVAEYIQDKKLLSKAELYASQGKRFGKKMTQDNLRFLFGVYRSLRD